MSNIKTETLEAQIRECFGRVVYSHKTHEKAADIILSKLSTLKLWQIILSAITTGGIITELTKIGNLGNAGAIVAAITSTILLAINTYSKDVNLGELGQKHKDAASKLWGIRESYFSLLTDIRTGDVNEELIRKRRDELQSELNAIYDSTPATNSKAYSQAQRALKVNEELTFSDHEIDVFLPEKLRKTGTKDSP
ncbi:SLATT domain-containing protein [Deinococcus phoenicis]|uniref:SLATT domain-containing protein n=1 Tax=Deinococcus phoenicis TaxID=1476583 RepID=UPI0009DFD598|nr:SLATT domain-containing protein [Deinococcus phoenicis]